MKVLKIDDTNAVLIKSDEFEYPLWMDVWMDKGGTEPQCDWNQYIFHLDDPKDVAIKAFQESCDNFEDFSSIAIEALENAGILTQNNDGTWNMNK